MSLDQTAQSNSDSPRQRLAIIGGGSSGLITLKYALDHLPDWEIVCYEKSDHITGCWGNPYPGFVSTSTKYTTQFSCHSIFAASVHQTESDQRSEFFRDDEYGKYLEGFATKFSLHQHILTNHSVERLIRDTENDCWELIVSRNDNTGTKNVNERFDAIALCTGLTAVPNPVECEVKTLSASDLNSPDSLERLTNQRIVVIGGGESAVDYAHRLAKPELNNQVFLSLKS